MPSRLPSVVFALFLCMLPVLPAPAGAQARGEQPAATPEGRLVEVELRDGSRLRGRIVEDGVENLVLETLGGTRVEVARAQIARIRELSGQVVGGAFWPEDPNRTRLLFASTARPLRQGEGYIASYMLFLPFVAYGVTDRLAIAGGTPILPGAMGEVFYLAPKYTVMSRPGVDLAAGVLALFATSEFDEGSVGLLYGVGTFGNPDRALTTGLGWGYFWGGGERELSNEPVVVLGGEARLSPRLKLVSENWLVIGGDDGGGVFTAGLRFIGDRLSGDLGLGAAAESGNTSCCLPVVNFVYNFGRR